MSLWWYRLQRHLQLALDVGWLRAQLLLMQAQRDQAQERLALRRDETLRVQAELAETYRLLNESRQRERKLEALVSEMGRKLTETTEDLNRARGLRMR